MVGISKKGLYNEKMHYKAPIRMLPSLTVNRAGPALRPNDISLPAKIAPMSPFDLADVLKMVEELKTMHRAVTEAMGSIGTAEEFKKMHAELMQKVEIAQHSFEQVKQGKQGDAGKAAKEVDLTEVARQAAALIPPPKNGDTPAVDHKKIARMAAKLIEVPKVTPGKDADPEKVARLIAEKFEAGEIKISHKNIEGLDDKFAETRSQVRNEVEQYGKNTWKRGGGGSGGTIQVADLSAQCNGSTKVFTIPSFTTIIGLVGTDAPIVYRPIVDFTVAAITLTLGAGVNAPSQGATLLLTYV